MASKDEQLAVRVAPSIKEQFNARCDAYGVSPADMLREIVSAFIEGKLRISVPENQLKILKGIHHVD